ncbi:MAG: RNA-binding protein [Sedimenticola sp.]|nr:RNA-binding protein [Sedimenticola sp.]
MWIIIQGIPLTTTQRELNQFLNKQISCKGWFGLSSRSDFRLKTFSILRMTDRASGEMECHGLAELETARPEEEVLKQLNGHRLHGRVITVRKYYHRSSRSIQRMDQMGGPSGSEHNERRRPYLHIEMLKANAGGFSIGLF